MLPTQTHDDGKGTRMSGIRDGFLMVENLLVRQLGPADYDRARRVCADRARRDGWGDDELHGIQSMLGLSEPDTESEGAA
jgi:hypothetical protein